MSVRDRAETYLGDYAGLLIWLSDQRTHNANSTVARPDQCGPGCVKCGMLKKAEDVKNAAHELATVGTVPEEVLRL